MKISRMVKLVDVGGEQYNVISCRTTHRHQIPIESTIRLTFNDIEKIYNQVKRIKWKDDLEEIING